MLALSSGPAAVLLAAAPALGTPAPATPTSANVLNIYQTNFITEQSTFTVYVKVADSSAIHFMYFTFCQLSSPLCYSPVAMTDQGSNLWAGTTNPMTSYQGMSPGVKAGYNVTIEYNGNVNLTEPSFPNRFANLSVGQEVQSNYWMFEITVQNHVYGVAGSVHDSATGRPIAGAMVSLTGSNASAVRTAASGDFSFGFIANGTYTMTVSASGYRTTNDSVVVRGGNVTQDVALTNLSSPSKGSSSGLGGAAFFGSPVGLGIIAVVVIVVVLAAVLLMRSRRSKGRAPGSAPPGGPASNTEPASPKSP